VPRKPRFTLPGVPQHVIQRGNNREPCFLAEQDYRRYLAFPGTAHPILCGRPGRKACLTRPEPCQTSHRPRVEKRAGCITPTNRLGNR